MIAFRLLVLVAVWLLGTSTISLAQQEGDTAEPPAQAKPEAGTPADEEEFLLVPDVRGLPYVFAKGVLEDAGFAWKVKGKVEGYAVNLVAEQSAKPGSRVLDTGAPTIVLRLEKNPDYEETGLPDNTSPYPGSKLVLANGGPPRPATAPADDEGAEGAGDEAGAEEEPAAGDDSAEPAATDETGTSEESSENAADVSVDVDVDIDVTVEEQARPPAFLVRGAPEEPLDEMPLPDRARKLAKWVAALDRVTPAALDHYTYQHAWVVTGARFGWWRGAEALRILVRVDEEMQRKFGIGAKSEAVARSALAEVLRKSARG